MQLGALGTSILFSSGDGGVSGGQSSSCTDFVPTYPSTCPYITSVRHFVSRLKLSETELGYRSEEQRVSVRRSLQISLRVDSPTSSEFRIIRQMVRTCLPPSQVSSLTPSLPVIAVASYLDFLGSTNSGKFNTSGRAFPDMSAQSENFIIAWDGEFGTVDGTSCSTPFFAGMVALLNNELINGGGAPLGFLNPLIYSATDAFTDITSGDNPGCNTNGFSATTSWDPVTGVGSPIYSALLAAASSG